jgi:hypothetical protein
MVHDKEIGAGTITSWRWTVGVIGPLRWAASDRVSGLGAPQSQGPAVT